MNSLLTSSLLTALLQSSLLVTGAWLLILTQRRTSAARRSAACRFTMAAALVLVAVTIGNMAFSLIPDSKPSIAIAPATLPQGAGTMAKSILLNPESSPAMERQRALPLPLPVIPAKDPQSNSSWTLPSAHARWLAFGWLTGSTLVLTVWLSSLAARLTLLRHSQKAAGVPWLQIAREVKSWPLVDEVRLVPQDITPCVWGVRKTVLALPASAASWPAAKLKLVLAHECAHLFRRDPLWQILGRFFLALLWFHPLAWNLARRSQAADEQAADDIVLRTECDGPSYANLLVECARQFSLPHALQTTASAMATPTTLARRVEAVLDPAADRRPVNGASFLTWAAAIALLSALSGYAAPEISTAPAQETLDPKREPKMPEADDDPLFTPPAETSQLEPEVSKDTIVLPNKSHPVRKTYTIRGSTEIRAHDFSISADEMTLEMESGRRPQGSMQTIDPMHLKSVSASASVVVEGKIDGVELTAKADSMSYSVNPPENGILLTGWPYLKTASLQIEGLHQDSRIIIGPNGSHRCDKCRISTLPPPRNPSSLATPAASETPITSRGGRPPAGPFSWQPVSLNGLDYLPAWQMKDFYQFPTLSNTGNGQDFLLRSNAFQIRGIMESNEIRVNNVRLLLKHRIMSSNGMPMISRRDLSLIIDPVIRPDRSATSRIVNTVVIDPGHGGIDTGASGPNGTEASFTLDTALRLKTLLEQTGFKVVLTRHDDSRVMLDERARIASAEENAVQISLHFSHDQDPSRQGLRTFFPDEKGLGENSSDYLKSSILLAVAVHANCVAKMRPTDGGAQEANFSALRRQTKTPAIFIEGGYLNHPREGALIATGDYRQTLASAIAGGLENYLRATKGHAPTR